MINCDTLGRGGIMITTTRRLAGSILSDKSWQGFIPLWRKFFLLSDCQISDQNSSQYYYEEITRSHHWLCGLLLLAAGAGRDDDEGESPRHLAEGGADVVD